MIRGYCDNISYYNFFFLDNEIYIGTFRFGKYNRKKEEQIVIENYCEPIITEEVWKKSRKQIKRNKHENYGKHVHIFSNLVVCPHCGNIVGTYTAC